MPTAVITGASRGLGRALAIDLASLNWNLLLDARTPGDLAEAVAEADARGAGRVVGIAGSVADPAHLRRLADEAALLGGPDLLVNNASQLGPSPQPALGDYPLETLRQVYDVNVVAPLELTQLLLPALRERRGTIVNITSDAAVEPYVGWGGYGSSKAALDQLTAILGAEEDRLRVYAFDPGDLRTQLHQEAFPGEDISDRPDPETVVPTLLRLVESGLPSGRYRAADVPAELLSDVRVRAGESA
jgi:NAD(P)-dependent dehydrogenase (short-subunit alcohol dehydrogenase family)